MRIAIHSYNYSGNDAGIAIVTRNTACILAEKHEVHIIAQDINILTGVKLPAEEKAGGCYVHRLGRSKIPVLGALVYFFRVVMKTRSIKPDVFHEQELCGVGYFVKKFLRIPVLVFGHGVDVFGRQNFLSKILKKLDVKNADVVMANTKSIADSFTVFGAENVILTRNGINFSDFEKKLKKESEKEFVIAGVGRLIPSKGFQTAIEALALVKGVKFRYIIVGSGDYETELKRLADEKKVNVIFAGRMKHEDVVNLLLKSDLFLFPTAHTETCSLVTLEAMAAGLPVITTNKVDFVEDNKNGFIVEENNVKQLAEKIKEMLSDKKRILEFGKVNKEKARGFDWSIVADELEKGYLAAFGSQKKK